MHPDTRQDTPASTPEMPAEPTLHAGYVVQATYASMVHTDGSDHTYAIYHGSLHFTAEGRADYFDTGSAVRVQTITLHHDQRPDYTAMAQASATRSFPAFDAGAWAWADAAKDPYTAGIPDRADRCREHCERRDGCEYHGCAVRAPAVDQA